MVLDRSEEVETLQEFLSEGEGTQEEVDKSYGLAINSVEELEFKKMLSSDEDQLSAMMEINPGAGGTESNDWAAILMRMYIMWGEKNGYTVKQVDYNAGDVAGVKSVTLQFDGPLAYG